MATINLLNNGSHKSCDDMKKVIGYVTKEAKTTYEGRKLVTGINCPADTAYTNMMLTKNYHRKTDGRMYYHLCQSFSPDEKITPELAHKVAVEFAERQFPGYECIVGTHVDREHIHSHIVFNSVSFATGKKYHSDKNDIQRWRQTSDEVCRKHGLSVVIPAQKNGMKQPRAREFRAIEKQNSWKLLLIVTIEEAMKRAKKREEFIRFMEEHGYKVTWTDTRKNITYTTPDGKRCRDNKLHETKFLKEAMEYEFRIREQILGSQRGIEEQHIDGSEGNTLRDDLGAELERDGKSSKVDRDDSEARGNERTDGRIREAIGQDLRLGSELAGGKGERYSHDNGAEIAEDLEGSGVTGWEAERAICFGTGENEEGIARRFQDIYGEDVSPFSSSVPVSDIAGVGAYLTADVAEMIEPEEQPEPDTTSKSGHVDKKEREKLAEKYESHGLKMGGM